MFYLSLDNETKLVSFIIHEIPLRNNCAILQHAELTPILTLFICSGLCHLLCAYTKLERSAVEESCLLGTCPTAHWIFQYKQQIIVIHQYQILCF